MKILSLLAVFLIAQCVKGQMIIDLDIEYPIGTKKIVILDQISSDSASYFYEIRKSIKNLQLKIYTPADFKASDFSESDKINSDLLKKTLWLTKENSDFDFGKPKSGNIETISIEIENDTLKLKEFIKEDQNTMRAYVEADLYLGDSKITNLSITKYADCYCDLESYCEAITTVFFPENDKKKLNFSCSNGCL